MIAERWYEKYLAGDSGWKIPINMTGTGDDPDYVCAYCGVNATRDVYHGCINQHGVSFQKFPLIQDQTKTIEAIDELRKDIKKLIKVLKYG